MSENQLQAEAQQHSITETQDHSITEKTEENLKQIEKTVLLEKSAENEEKREKSLLQPSPITNSQEIKEMTVQINNCSLSNATPDNSKTPEKETSHQLHITTLDSAKNSIFVPGHKSSYQESSIYEQVVEEYEDGTRYEGEKYLEKRHGRGVYYYLEGYRYDGTWENDTMSGFGTLWLDEKNKLYEGEFKEGLFHGKGTVYNTQPRIEDLKNFDGGDFTFLGGGWERFEGQYIEGKKNGLGSLFMLNGDLFVGKFVNDAVEGRGSYTSKSGKIRIGLWKDNLLIKEL